MNPQPRSRCNCGKVKSSSLQAARLLHARIWAREGGSDQVRFYQCRYSYWHWTQQELRTKKAA